MVEKEFETMRKENEEAKKQLCEFEKENEVLKAVIEAKDETIAQFSEVNITGGETREMREQREKLEQEVRELRKENEELSGELIIKREKAEAQDTLEKQVNELQKDNDALRELIDAVSTEKEATRKDLRECQDKLKLELERNLRLEDMCKKSGNDTMENSGLISSRPGQNTISLVGSTVETIVPDASQFMLQPDVSSRALTSRGPSRSVCTLSRENDVPQVLMKAHLKMKQMNDCIRKLLEGKAMEDDRYQRILAKYQKSCDELSSVEQELVLLKKPMNGSKANLREINEPGSQTIILNKENIAAEMNSAVNHSIDERTVTGMQRKAGKCELFVKRASALVRPSSVLGHKGMKYGDKRIVINLPPNETPSMVTPMTARGKQTEKITEFKRLMRQQSTKSNPKGRSQLSLGDAKIIRSCAQMISTPSAAMHSKQKFGKPY